MTGSLLGKSRDRRMSETSVVSVDNSAGPVKLKRNFKKRHVHLCNEYSLCIFPSYSRHWSRRWGHRGHPPQGEAEARGSKVSGQPVLHTESLFQNNNSREKQEERESGDQRGHREGTNNQVQIATGAVVSAKTEVPWDQVSEP